MNTFLGLGTAAIGRPEYINIRQESSAKHSLSEFKSKGIGLLMFAYKQGIHYFDTAPGYGMAEEMLINWLYSLKPSPVDIATKWGYTYTANFDPNAKVHEVKEHSIDKLNEQWEFSKALLPRLKYYQIHSASFESGVLNNDKILNRLNELKEKHNLIIGLTTTGTNQLGVLQKALEIEKNGSQLFQLFQVTYNIFDQSLRTIADSITSKLVIKEALANGRVFPNEDFPNYTEAYHILSKLSQKYKVGIDAIALRFCMDSIPVFKVLSGAATIEHLKSNLKANDFRLKQEDIDLLNSLAVNSNTYWNERKKLNWN
ncbi:aldo/keto reductase [Muriicola sp.]|uniref:aldo/keto reductase n=1 Tax=Muriicola sp. TaxID=2020856 RepID=UPI003C778180